MVLERGGGGGGDGVCCLGRGQSLRSQNSERSRDPLSREWGGAGGGLSPLQAPPFAEIINTCLARSNGE